MTEEIAEKDISSSDLYLALEDLVMYALKQQIREPNRNENLYDWANEKCTVKFAGPRGCGHSTAVVKLCKYIFKNPLVIVMDHTEAANLSKKFEVMGVNKPDILTASALVTNSGRLFTQYDGVIVDNAGLFELDYMDLIYRSFINGKFLVSGHVFSSFCFVLVG